MRLCLIAIVLLGCANLVLAPVGMTHAHLGLADHSITHAGHVHTDPAQGYDQETGAVLDLSSDATGPVAKAIWTQFAAVFFLLGLVWIITPTAVHLTLKKSRQSEPIRRPCSPPHLRGPPRFSR
jgi:hypothetical protein